MQSLKLPDVRLISSLTVFWRARPTVCNSCCCEWCNHQYVYGTCRCPAYMHTVCPCDIKTKTSRARNLQVLAPDSQMMLQLGGEPHYFQTFNNFLKVAPQTRCCFNPSAYGSPAAVRRVQRCHSCALQMTSLCNIHRVFYL